MLKGVSVPSLICSVLGVSWQFFADSRQFLSADSAMCVALLANTTVECKTGARSHCASFKIGLGRVRKSSKMKPRGVSGWSCAHGVSRTQRGARIRMKIGAMLVPFGRCCVPFWRPLDFEGPICLVCFDVFGATANTRKTIYFFTTAPRKWENANQRRAETKRRSITVDVSTCFRFFRKRKK